MAYFVSSELLFYRNGALFMSHILGCPTVLSMIPELNRCILTNEGKGLVPGYPQSMLDVLGSCNIASVSGSLHKAMRSSMMGLVGTAMIRGQLLTKIDEFMRSHLSIWNHNIIDTQQKTKEVGYSYFFKKMEFEMAFYLTSMFMASKSIDWSSA